MKRVALVTGAARGIGFAIAKALAAEGNHVAVCDIQDREEIRDALTALKNTGAEVLYCRADVADPEARQRLLVQIRKHFGRINILVNNAGVAPKVRADILEATEESYERVMKINLQGPYFLTQAVARWMVEQLKLDRTFTGGIVNISSTSAEVASVSRGEYCLSKAGVSMATKLWAARLGEYGIPVYEVRPGIIETDMTAAVKETYDKRIAEGLLLQARWGKPEDVARVVAAMVRGDLGYSTGQAVCVDGGLTVRRL